MNENKDIENYNNEKLESIKNIDKNGIEKSNRTEEIFSSVLFDSNL